ncbi:MAG: hypothetical protein ACI8QI_001925 [Limisphaerales bacterium]|jgi:hypothetical protein
MSKSLSIALPQRGVRNISGKAGFHNAKKKVALAKREN